MLRCCFTLLTFTLPAIALAAPPDFDRQVAPLLASRCLDCHSGAMPKGDLDLSRKSLVLEGDAAMVAPGKLEASELWKRIEANEMPPKKPLTASEKQIVKEWILSGAKWGRDPIDPFRFTTASRAGYDWWSLQPIARPAVPAGRNPIDFLVQRKLSDNGLSLSASADRRTLIRRVTFDLIGLPPTPEEVAAFLKEDAPDAYEKLVDRLLASPHYGERWARHWLDVVRFGETDGFERNAVRPNAWHYRDWVIRAFNSDMPFDEFARLQLAGDLLHPGDPDAVKATGFLVAGLHNTVLGNDQMRAIARQDELEDLVGSVGQTFLGMTVNCARCHDHKFDPIAQTDFYRLAASISGVNHGERVVEDGKSKQQIATLDKELQKLIAELAALEAPARKAALAELQRESTGVVPPSPIAAWDFRTGKLDVKLVGEAKLTDAGAVLDGKTALVRTAPLQVDLRAKTLEAWVKLDNLTQRGGGVMSVQTPNGTVFDAIVFGEREPTRWMAGSNNFVRTQSFSGSDEKDAANRITHVAITYADDGSITAFREGKFEGKPYISKGPITFKAREAVVVFGCRHEPAGGNRMLAGTVVAARLYDRALTADEVSASFQAGPSFLPDSAVEAKLSPEDRTRRTALLSKRTELGNALAKLRPGTSEKVYAVVPKPPGVTHFLHRGDVANPGDVVAPAGLSALGDAANFGLAADASDAERRLKLARWITAPGNPLFARVIANRLWHYHFGTGIVETPNDFGFNGGRPSHPALLDWLAAELVSRDFSLKDLHRLIVTSATYRQASAPKPAALTLDADNRWLWRTTPHRLEGEAVRDSMLSIAGLLNRDVGGKGFSDYRERNFNGTAYFDPFDPVGLASHRRSIYRFVPRGGNRGLLDAFDCPDPAAAAPRRSITTTPLQALALWNSGFALRMSDAFAARVEGEAPNDVPKQVRRAWQLAYQREPTAQEAKLAETVAADHGLRAICRVLFNSNEFLTID